jgi:hypothetical protein
MEPVRKRGSTKLHFEHRVRERVRFVKPRFISNKAKRPKGNSGNTNVRHEYKKSWTRA